MARFEQHGAPLSGFFKKTKMCKFKRLGMCTRGESCTYAHNAEELCPLPNLYKTKMCFDMSKNKHCQNPSCPYAHTKAELRNVAYENQQDEHEVNQPGLGNVVFYAQMPKFWFPAVHMGSSAWAGASSQSRFQGDSPTPSTGPAVSPASSYSLDPMTPPRLSLKEDSGSLNGTVSRQTTSNSQNSISQGSSDESEQSESEAMEPPPMKWTIKNTFLELSPVGKGVSGENAASRMFRSSSLPVLT